MNKETVTYKGLTLDVIIDGAGLDIIATDEASLTDIARVSDSISHELFCKVFDYGYSKGLRAALVAVGAEVVGA